jgi:hypothetical protein
MGTLRVHVPAPAVNSLPAYDSRRGKPVKYAVEDASAKEFSSRAAQQSRSATPEWISFHSPVSMRVERICISRMLIAHLPTLLCLLMTSLDKALAIVALQPSTFLAAGP